MSEERPFRMVKRDIKAQTVDSETFVREFRNFVCEWLPRNCAVVYIIGAPAEQLDAYIVWRHITAEKQRAVLDKMIRGCGVSGAITEEQADKMREILNS